ncbi:hypothetical protein PENTCL1PPCAC_12268, partial [Pristionchus entomophagus]
SSFHYLSSSTMASTSTANAPSFKIGEKVVPIVGIDQPRDQQVDHPVSDAIAAFDDKRTAGQDFDAKIIVGREIFSAHKDLLVSRIPFFYALFSSNLAESKTGEVTITEFDAATIKSLLDYAYTGRITITEDNVQDLAMGANFWQIESVTDECSDFMRRRLRVANALPIQHICRSMGHVKFTPMVDGFIDKNFVSVSQTPEFLQLSVEELDGFLHRNSINVDDESQVFEALTRWMGTDEGKMQHGARLLRAVRCTRLPLEYITGTIEKTLWVASNHQCIELVNEAKAYISNKNSEMKSFNRAERICYDAHRVIMPVGWLSNAQNPATSTMSAYDPIMNVWQQCENLKGVRGRNAVAIIGKTIYAMGGYNGTERLATCEQYDTQTNQWSDLPDMSCKRAAMAYGVIDGKIYVAGGYDGSAALKNVEVFDPSTKTWSPVAPMTKPRGAPASCVYNGRLYVIGGHDGTVIWSDGEYYNPENNTWTAIAPMMKSNRAQKRCRFGAAVLNGKIYVAGGFDGAAFLRDVARYDPSTNTWENLKDMETRRSRACLAVSCGKLFVLGGFDGLNNVSRVDMYQPEADSWLQRADMPNAGGIFVGMLPVPATIPSPVANLEEGDIAPVETA